MGRIYETHRRPPAQVDRQAVDVLRRHRPGGRRTGTSTSRPKGPIGSLQGARRPHGRLPGHRRQRRGDDRPPARERPHRVMFCAFEGPPRILRLHGRGEVVLPGRSAVRRAARAGFHEPEAPEARRAIIVVHVHPRSPTPAATACRCWPTRASARTATCRPPSGCGSKGRTPCATTRQSTTGCPSTASPLMSIRASTRSCSAKTPSHPRVPARRPRPGLRRRRRRLADLQLRRPSRAPERDRGHYELYLMCDDIEETRAELEAKGVEFTRRYATRAGASSPRCGPRR